MTPNPAEPRPLVLAGPTASGKSEVALLLAEQLGGEIISVDSMQVYRGLDIGTAKPTAVERRRVPHHLIDVIELSESFDVAQFVRLATDAVASIRSRGKVPILCGGTGLYFKAFLAGLGEAPPADAKLRLELESIPLANLLEELRQRDAATFERIDRQNPRRVIRAVEILRLTGKPIQRADWAAANPNTIRGYGLTRPASELHARINARVDAMFARGLVDETRQLLARGLESNQTAMQAIGYRQVAEHLRGLRPLAETIELVKIRTRQFAKRQMTWFRRHAQLEWIRCEPGEPAQAVAARLIAEYHSNAVGAQCQ
jgi:tRNA dimethylallyltransferase